jgi:hypothetical protein
VSLAVFILVAVGGGTFYFMRSARLKEEARIQAEQDRLATERLRQEEEIRQFNAYVDSVTLAVTTMGNGLGDAETTLDMIEKIWENAIYNKKDPETDPYTLTDEYTVNRWDTVDFN